MKVLCLAATLALGAGAALMTVTSGMSQEGTPTPSDDTTTTPAAGTATPAGGTATPSAAGTTTPATTPTATGGGASDLPSTGSGGDNTNADPALFLGFGGLALIGAGAAYTAMKRRES